MLVFSFIQYFGICFYSTCRSHTNRSRLFEKVDPQIYTLLNGEILSSPPQVDEKLVDDAIVQAMQLEKEYQANDPTVNATPSVGNNSNVANNSSVEEMHGHLIQR